MGFGDIAKRRPDRIQYSDGLFCFVTLIPSPHRPFTPLALFILTYPRVSGCDFTKLDNVLNLQNVFVRVSVLFFTTTGSLSLFITVYRNMKGSKSRSKNVSAVLVK